ncbi:MAG: hypothetical protein HYZ34_06925 [Ignavibacteriae bacterium]|nr:hypothetical protein [Ignavibacteriota bacterium]
MKQLRLLITVVLLFAVALITNAQSKKVNGEKNEMKEVTLTGEIIDQKCYTTGMMGGKGEDHKECAISCIKGGLPVGLLEDKTEKVYTVVPKAGMKGANEELAKYAAQKVKLTGMAATKGGQSLFIYTKIEEIK